MANTAMQRATERVTREYLANGGDRRWSDILRKAVGLPAAGGATGQQGEASLQSAIPQSSASVVSSEAQTVMQPGVTDDDDDPLFVVPRWKFGKGATLLGG